MADSKIHLEDFRKIATQKQLLLDGKDILFMINEHNKIINEFCDSVLPNYVDEKKMIDRRTALSYLSIYANGSEVRKAYEHFKKIKFDEKQMNLIIETLKKPLPELYAIGQVAVQIMFVMFQSYAQKHWNEERYKKIYKSDSPIKWIRKVKEYPDVDNAKSLANFHDYANINRKVQDILNTKLRI